MEHETDDEKVAGSKPSLSTTLQHSEGKIFLEIPSNWHRGSAKKLRNESKKEYNTMPLS